MLRTFSPLDGARSKGFSRGVLGVRKLIHRGWSTIRLQDINAVLEWRVPT